MKHMRKMAFLAVLMVSLPVMACKVNLFNDNIDYTKKLRVLVNSKVTDFAQYFVEGEVSGALLHACRSKEIKPRKTIGLGSKRKMNTLYVYEKIGRKRYKLIAIIEQTAQAGRGQEVLVNLSDLKANKFDTNLLQVTLK